VVKPNETIRSKAKKDEAVAVVSAPDLALATSKTSVTNDLIKGVNKGEDDKQITSSSTTVKSSSSSSTHRRHSSSSSSSKVRTSGSDHHHQHSSEHLPIPALEDDSFDNVEKNESKRLDTSPPLSSSTLYINQISSSFPTVIPPPLPEWLVNFRKTSVEVGASEGLGEELKSNSAAFLQGAISMAPRGEDIKSYVVTESSQALPPPPPQPKRVRAVAGVLSSSLSSSSSSSSSSSPSRSPLRSLPNILYFQENKVIMRRPTVRSQSKTRPRPNACLGRLGWVKFKFKRGNEVANTAHVSAGWADIYKQKRGNVVEHMR
jgi:hypothetical protein